MSKGIPDTTMSAPAMSRVYLRRRNDTDAAVGHLRLAAAESLASEGLIAVLALGAHPTPQS